MTLAELPHNAACTIRRICSAVQGTAYQLVGGIYEGNVVRVLAKYPTDAPRFLEVEVGSGLVVTLPISIAQKVTLDCACD